MMSLLSGPLDVDKQDYLLRDSHFCGVKYGIYDIDRLIETLRVCQDKGDRYLAISEDGILTLEQFVIARYHMTGQVYRHKVRLITDAMIERGIELGIETDGLRWLKDLYSYDGSPDFLHNYLEWDDERLVWMILGGERQKGCAYQMFDRLANRRLFKLLLRMTSNQLDPIAWKLFLQDDQAKLRGLKKGIEKVIASQLQEIDPQLVIAKILRQPSAAQTEASILIFREDVSPTQFRDESTLFRSIDAAIQEVYLDIYAPVAWADHDERKRKQDMFKREIVPAINDFLKSTFAAKEAITDAISGGGTENGSK